MFWWGFKLRDGKLTTWNMCATRQETLEAAELRE
jgi:hypothetical protein